MSKIKVKELKGLKSLRAFGAFHSLLLGLKMLPAYMGESYEDFFNRVHIMDDHHKEKIFTEAAMFVELEDHEIEALGCFCTDPNGISYNSTNLPNLGPKELIEMIVAVCMELSRIKIDILTDAEKKK